ncbi:MAG: hypothetical protein IJP48_07515 [Synergistaceae bacterium]|nr:hypothetical protein [Synergistaceae bacterium]
MTWRIKYTEQARKTLRKLDNVTQNRIETYINDLCELSNPRDRGNGVTALVIIV